MPTYTLAATVSAEIDIRKSRFIALAIPVMVRPLLPGNLRVPVPWLSVVVAFVVACSTGLFFGYLPADKAAKLQPTESLRYE